MSIEARTGQLAGPENYCHFFEEDQFLDTDREGFRRRIITGEHLELWFWRISGGMGGSVLHHHPDNEQIGIIMRGALDFRIGDHDDQRRVTLRAGDVYLAAMNVWHGDSNFIGDDELNEVWILDVFSPPRSDAKTGPAS
jgi:mannose-6-phosphate isomerase-like protein (cupin superfamily)